MEILVVVDMQRDFVSGALGSREAEAIVPKVAERVREGRARGEKLLFTRDTHEKNYLETQEGRNLPVPHCIRGTAGWEIIPELQPFVEETPVDKPTFGSEVLGRKLKALHEELLAAGKPGVERITFLGLCTDICVISNALMAKAFLPEAEIRVDASCCAGVTPASHQTALDAMKACQITVEREA